MRCFSQVGGEQQQQTEQRLDEQIRQEVFEGQKRKRPKGVAPYQPDKRVEDRAPQQSVRQRLYRNELSDVKKRKISIYLTKSISPQDVLEILQKFSWGLDHAHVCAGFNMLGKLASHEHVAYHSQSAKKSHEILLEASIRLEQTMGVREVSQGIWSLGKWGFKDVENEGFVFLMKLVRELIEEFEPRHLSMIFHGLAGIEWPSRESVDVETLDALAAQILSNLDNTQQPITYQALSNITWACAKLEYSNKVLLKDIGSKVAQSVYKFQPKELCNVVWGFASLNLCHKLLMDATIKYALERMEDLTIVDLADLVWSFAKLKVHSKELFHALEEQLLFRYLGESDKFSRKSLTYVAWGFSTAGFINPHLFQLLTKIIQKKVHKLLPEDISLISFAFSNANYYNQYLFDGLCRVAVRRSANFKPDEILNVIHALSKTGHLNEYTFETLTFHLGQNIEELSLKQVAQYSENLLAIGYNKISVVNQIENQFNKLIFGPYKDQFSDFQNKLKKFKNSQKISKFVDDQLSQKDLLVWKLNFSHVFDVLCSLAKFSRWDVVFQIVEELNFEFKYFKNDNQQKIIMMLMLLEIYSKKLNQQFDPEKINFLTTFFQQLYDQNYLDEFKNQNVNFENKNELINEIKECASSMGIKCTVDKQISDFGFVDLEIKFETINFNILIALNQDLTKRPLKKPMGFFDLRVKYLQNAGCDVMWIQKEKWEELQNISEKQDFLQELIQNETQN